MQWPLVAAILPGPMLRPPPLAIQRHQLDNGLRIVLHADTTLPLVTVNLWYHTGSKNERPGKTGFAHLFEHMLFQGSENVGNNDHFRYIQQVGGVANGSTWYDRTNYFETLPADCLELGLWLESDRMGFLLPAMTQEKLDNQRGVVMNERRQRVDNQPYGFASERLNELLFPERHPYHWPVIGYMQDIEAATLEDVQEFFSTYYVPNNAVLSLVGDFDPDQARDLVADYFDEIPPGDSIPPVEDCTDFVTDDPVETMDDDVQLPRSYIGFHLSPFGDRDWYAADLLATLLADGKASVLYRDLVYDREIAQTIGAHALPTEELGSFRVIATAKPGVTAERLETEILLHLDRIADEGPTDEDVERAKNRILLSYFSELQTVGRKADLLSMFTTYFDAPERLSEEPQIYDELEGADVQAIARRWLRPDQRARVRVVPRDGNS